MVELAMPTSSTALAAELNLARLELAQRAVSENNAVAEQRRLERMLRDSQRFLVEHEVNLAEAKLAAEHALAGQSEATQQLASCEDAVAELTAELGGVKKRLASAHEQAQRLSLRQASLANRGVDGGVGDMRELDVYRQTAAGVAALHDLEAVNGELLRSQATLRAANGAMADQQSHTGAQLQRTSRRLELSDGLLEPALGAMRRMQSEAAEAAAHRSRLARATEEEAKLRAKLARLALQAHAGLVAMHAQLAQLAGPPPPEGFNLVQIISNAAEATRSSLAQMQALRPFAAAHSPPLAEQLRLLSEHAAPAAAQPSSAADPSGRARVAVPLRPMPKGKPTQHFMPRDGTSQRGARSG
eukprot:scaffold52626_cov61-Phaeocystis_antarctica.AAC.2